MAYNQNYAKVSLYNLNPEPKLIMIPFTLTTITFEEMFSDVEARADNTKKAASTLAKNASQLRKAAQDGNINGIRKARERLGQSLNELQKVVATAISTWEFEDAEVASYMTENYADELAQVTKELGFDIFARDGALISYPSTMRLLPAEMALRLDRKKVSNLRPSKLAEILRVNREKSVTTSRQARFLESLYKVYNIVAKAQRAGRGHETFDLAPVVKLEQIYEMFTSLPSSNRDYDKMDFARDIYFLDAGEIKTTKSGATVSFPTSTGLKSGRGIISFVGRDGNPISYYGIQFSGGQ